MTWTKPAWSGSPLMSRSTSVLLRKVTSPANSLDVCAHQSSCSGRSLLRCAASSESNRTTAMSRPSSVTPPVDPSHPRAPGEISCAHRSTAALVSRWVAHLSLDDLDEHREPSSSPCGPRCHLRRYGGAVAASRPAQADRHGPLEPRGESSSVRVRRPSLRAHRSGCEREQQRRGVPGRSCDHVRRVGVGSDGTQ